MYYAYVFCTTYLDSIILRIKTTNTALLILLFYHLRVAFHKFISTIISNSYLWYLYHLICALLNEIRNLIVCLVFVSCDVIHSCTAHKSFQKCTLPSLGTVHKRRHLPYLLFTMTETPLWRQKFI